jgi:hypothetical protein
VISSLSLAVPLADKYNLEPVRLFVACSSWSVLTFLCCCTHQVGSPTRCNRTQAASAERSEKQVVLLFANSFGAVTHILANSSRTNQAPVDENTDQSSTPRLLDGATIQSVTVPSIN